MKAWFISLFTDDVDWLAFFLGDRIARMVRVRAFEAAINGAAHDCSTYRLADGDCEACWLASK